MEENISEELAKALKEFAETQIPLDEDIGLILNDLLWDLYIEDNNEQ